MSDEFKQRFDAGGISENPKMPGDIMLKNMSQLLGKFYDRDDMNKVVWRLGDIGWLERENCVKEDWTAIHLSPKGKEKMLKFVSLTMSSKMDPSDKQLGFGSVFEFLENEFNPPLIFKESAALAALFLEYFVKNVWQKLPWETGSSTAM